jgi:hypothetical protein
MIIERDPNHARLLELELTDAGCHVIGGQTFDSVMVKLGEAIPDLVILSPSQDLSASSRLDRTYPAVPRICYSVTEPAIRASSLCRFVRKSSDVCELLKAVSQLLGDPTVACDQNSKDE